MNMPASPTTDHAQNLSSRHQRRPAWRRRLVEMERGVAFGFRSGGVVSVHCFFGLIGLVTGLVLGLNVLEWALLLVCFFSSLSLELVHQAIRVLCRTPGSSIDAARRAECAASAAATLALCGGLLVAALVLGTRAVELWD